MIRNRETAWLSMKDTLLHIMWVEDTWINHSIQGLEDPNRPFPYHKFQTWNALIDYNQEVTSKTKTYLSNIQKEDLLKPISRVNKDAHILRMFQLSLKLTYFFIQSCSTF